MIGVDVVDIERLRATLARSPLVRERLFSAAEIIYCSRKVDPVRHLAGTMAAKEAVIKVLGLGPLPAWARRIEILRSPDGAPSAVVADSAAQLALSISHDGGMAVAVAMQGTPPFLPQI